jgi:hypothetical protein
MHPAIDAALARSTPRCRAAGCLPDHRRRPRKGTTLDFAKGTSLLEVGGPIRLPPPRPLAALWPAAARAPFEAFHAARQAMQRQMDASIAAHADQECCTTSPRIAKTKRRVAGPFTVEAVPFPTVAVARRSERRRPRPTPHRSFGRDLAPAPVARRAAQDRHPRQGRTDAPARRPRAAAFDTRMANLHGVGHGCRQRRARGGELRARSTPRSSSARSRPRCARPASCSRCRR